jgi:hypothetical protein
MLHVSFAARLAIFTRNLSRHPMLDSVVVAFDVPTRIRELESSIARRMREALRPNIPNQDALERTVHELMLVSRDHAGSFHAIQDRARIRRENELE